MNQLFYIAFFSEILAAVLGTIYFNKYRDSSLMPIIIILWYIPVNELLCQYFFARTPVGYLLYNLYDIIVPLGILFITSNQIQDSFRKKVVRGLIGIAIVAFCINLYFINPFNDFLLIGFTFAALLVVIGLLYYLIELLKSDQIINVRGDLFLWISVGFLIFFLAFPVIFFARKFIPGTSEDLLRALDKIHYSVSILSYLVIAFGFYYGDKRVSISQTQNP